MPHSISSSALIILVSLLEGFRSSTDECGASVDPGAGQESAMIGGALCLLAIILTLMYPVRPAPKEEPSYPHVGVMDAADLIKDLRVRNRDVKEMWTRRDGSLLALKPKNLEVVLEEGHTPHNQEEEASVYVFGRHRVEVEAQRLRDEVLTLTGEVSQLRNKLATEEAAKKALASDLAAHVEAAENQNGQLRCEINGLEKSLEQLRQLDETKDVELEELQGEFLSAIYQLTSVNQEEKSDDMLLCADGPIWEGDADHEQVVDVSGVEESSCHVDGEVDGDESDCRAVEKMDEKCIDEDNSSQETKEDADQVTIKEEPCKKLMSLSLSPIRKGLPAMTPADSFMSFASDGSASSVSSLGSNSPVLCKKTIKLSPQPNAEWDIIE